MDNNTEESTENYILKTYGGIPSTALQFFVNGE